MRISDWSSDVCSSDLVAMGDRQHDAEQGEGKAEDLCDRDEGPEEHEIDEETEHGNARLLDRDIDRRRVFQRGIEDRFESGVCVDAVEDQTRHPLAIDTPVLTQLRHREREDERKSGATGK